MIFNPLLIGAYMTTVYLPAGAMYSMYFYWIILSSNNINACGLDLPFLYFLFAVQLTFSAHECDISLRTEVVKREGAETLSVVELKGKKRKE